MDDKQKEQLYRMISSYVREDNGRWSYVEIMAVFNIPYQVAKPIKDRLDKNGVINHDHTKRKKHLERA